LEATFVTITNLYTTPPSRLPAVHPASATNYPPADILLVAADNGLAGNLIPIAAARNCTVGG